jgi:hypothetical protein
LCVQFVWSTTGSTPSDGGTSHGDVWSWYDGATINPDLKDFRSRWVVDQFSVENDQVISSGNPHSTKAIVKTSDIPVTVQDLACPASPALCEGLAGFGQVSHVDVNGGSIPGTTWYHFVIQADSSEIPSGTNQNNVVVNHSWTQTGVDCDGVTPLDPVTTQVTCYETIVDRCTIAKQTGEPTNAEACIVVKRLSGNDLMVDVWTHHNGAIRLQ